MTRITSFTDPLARLVIDLDAVARNYLYLAKKLKSGADCAAVVKGDAYGLGAVEISKVLFAQSCRHFFVAQIEEAMSIKWALPAADEPGNDLSIYVLDGPRGASAKDFANAKLVPVLNSFEDIEYWAGFAAETGRKLPAVIHIDTGMNRLGLSADEVARLAQKREILKALDIRYVMSHLACADTPEHPMNRTQLDGFQKLSGSLGLPFRYSLANSGGIMLGQDYHFDLARPGCALYGISPIALPFDQNPMQGVVTFEARILQIRDIAPPATVGYSATYPISSPAKCATISVGYADGYLRSLQKSGMIVIHGEKCPVVGRVSMDSIVVDVTRLKTAAQTGDVVEIIGANQTVDEVAAQAGTIGYEILTGLGKRVPRTYKLDGKII